MRSGMVRRLLPHKEDIVRPLAGVCASGIVNLRPIAKLVTVLIGQPVLAVVKADRGYAQLA